MRVLVLKILFIGVVSFFGIRATDTLFRDQHFFRNSIQNLKDIKDVEVFIFGSSRAHSSYDPRIFEKTLGLKTMNLGAPAQKFEATQVVADYAFSHHEPTWVVVDIFNLSIGPYYVEKSKFDQLMTLNQIPITLEKAKTVNALFEPKDFFNTLSTTVRNHGVWNQVSSGEFMRTNVVHNGQDFYNGYRAYFKAFDDKTWQEFLKKYEGKKKSKKKIIVNSEEFEKIDKLVALFDKHNSKVLFVNSPTYVMDYNPTSQAYAEQINAYLSKKDIAYIDFNEFKDSLGLKKEHFSDPNHLNPQGAQIVSEYLASFIKNRMGQKRGHLPKEYVAKNRFIQIENTFKNALITFPVKATGDSISSKIDHLALLQTDKDRLEIVLKIKDSSKINIPLKIVLDKQPIRVNLTDNQLFVINGSYYLFYPFKYSDSKTLDLQVYTARNSLLFDSTSLNN